MVILVFTVLAVASMVVTRAVDLGGAMAGVVGLTVLFIGVMIHVTKPILDWVRGTSS